MHVDRLSSCTSLLISALLFSYVSERESARARERDRARKSDCVGGWVCSCVCSCVCVCVLLSSNTCDASECIRTLRGGNGLDLVRVISNRGLDFSCSVCSPSKSLSMCAQRGPRTRGGTTPPCSPGPHVQVDACVYACARVYMGLAVRTFSYTLPCPRQFPF